MTGAKQAAKPSGGPTPGPWAARPTASIGPQWEVYTEAGENTIAVIFFCYDNTAANARLIAAAPEMLAALRESLGTHGDPCNANCSIVKRHRTLLARIDGDGGAK